MQGISLTKICSNCGAEKATEMFPKRGNQCKYCQKEKREAIKEKKRQYDLKYRDVNKEKLSQQRKSYDQKNKQSVKVSKRVYKKQRRANDPVFRIRDNVSGSIYRMLKANKSYKNGVSCLNAGPCQEFKRCWALDNLRPLSAKQNLIDGVTKSRHEQTGNENA